MRISDEAVIADEVEFEEDEPVFAVLDDEDPDLFFMDLYLNDGYALPDPWTAI